MCIFFVFIRELHLETLYSAWQLEDFSDEMEPIDIVTNKKNYFNSTRHIFNFIDHSGGIIRIRSLDGKSDPRFIAKSGAEYCVHAGESTLLVNNRKQVLFPDKNEYTQGKGLHSWLTGHIEETAVKIQESSKGYDVLCDEFLNLTEPWVKTMPEIRDLFATLSTQYDKVILLDPSVHTERLLAGDALAPDIDILTLKGGTLSVRQSLATIQRERQAFQAKRTVILVMNNEESINLFSLNGFFKLSGRFFLFPFKMFFRY